jgi:hypothetical protein
MSTLKTCIECGKPLAERVEEVDRAGTIGSLSTGLCSTYRAWYCINPDCVMLNTALYREQLADSAG